LVLIEEYWLKLLHDLVLLVIACFKAAEKIKALVTAEQITNLLKG
jgi:hypothetical protein